MKDIIHQTAWDLLDIEVCLFRDGYPNPIGPGIGTTYLIPLTSASRKFKSWMAGSYL